MKITHLLIAGAISIGLVEIHYSSTCKAEQSVTEKSKSVEIKEIWSNSRKITDSRYQVIINNQYWRKLQKTMDSQNTDEPRNILPQVDFSKSIIIHIYQAKSGCKEPKWRKIVGLLTPTGDLRIKFQESKIGLMDDISGGRNETCNAYFSETTLFKVDRTGIQTIQNKKLLDYAVDPILSFDRR